MRSKVDEFDVDKLAPVPTDSTNPSDAVKSEVVKKALW